MTNIYEVKMSEEQYKDYVENYLTIATNTMDVPKPTKGEFGKFNTHPTIKPLKLMKWLVKLQSSENDIVLDPFNGSGTTAQACVELGRNYIGCEMNPEYINISKMRLGMPEDEEHPEDWNHELATFLLGDCIEQMKSIPDNSVTAIITDPPYAIAIAKWDTFETMEHFAEFTEQWAKECYRVLKPGGTISSFNASRTYHWMASAIDKAGFTCRDMIEWVYWSGMPKGKNLKGCHEPIYMGAKLPKGTPVGAMTYNLDDVRIPVKEKKVKGEPNSKKVIINKLEFEVTTSNEIVKYD
jgi:DNA modification methylase